MDNNNTWNVIIDPNDATSLDLRSKHVFPSNSIENIRPISSRKQYLTR